ncbi:MAG: hypothetical protein KatS3mg095_0631 [Candidatus Parcubacteria bacterium]|nr:MAG: hypothetical protein KatS3mg095_0631 [Candidatus Parcubacteria bacterium]
MIWGNIAPNNERKFLKNIDWPNMHFRDLTDIIYIIKNYLSILNESVIIYKEPLNIHWVIVNKKRDILFLG